MKRMEKKEEMDSLGKRALEILNYLCCSDYLISLSARLLWRPWSTVRRGLESTTSCSADCSIHSIAGP